jgi:hypothetical protein
MGEVGVFFIFMGSLPVTQSMYCCQTLRVQQNEGLTGEYFIKKYIDFS